MLMAQEPPGYLPGLQATGASRAVNFAVSNLLAAGKARQYPFQPMAIQPLLEHLVIIPPWEPHGYLPVLQAAGASRAVN